MLFKGERAREGEDFPPLNTCDKVRQVAISAPCRLRGSKTRSNVAALESNTQAE